MSKSLDELIKTKSFQQLPSTGSKGNKVMTKKKYLSDSEFLTIGNSDG